VSPESVNTPIGRRSTRLSRSSAEGRHRARAGCREREREVLHRPSLGHTGRGSFGCSDASKAHASHIMLGVGRLRCAGGGLLAEREWHGVWRRARVRRPERPDHGEASQHRPADSWARGSGRGRQGRSNDRHQRCERSLRTFTAAKRLQADVRFRPDLHSPFRSHDHDRL